MLRELKIEKNSLFSIETESEYYMILVMRDTATDSAFPISIGPTEGASISIAVDDVSVPRPLTHDLFKNVIIGLGYMLSKVVVTELRDNTYYANIYLEKEGRPIIVIDSRPSDAIALALRFSSPIFIEEQVFMASLESEETKKFLEIAEKIIDR